MSIPVNLYVDRMAPESPVRVADVYAVTTEHPGPYKEAAAKIGLTPAEYGEFRRSLMGGGAVYVRLPRHIDAMAGIHRRNGHVYALRNVLVPAGTMGWEVNLADGTTVIVPQICGNLSMNRGKVIAAARPVVVAKRHQPKAVLAAAYTAQPVPQAIPAAEYPETPVTFTPPVAAPIAIAPVAATAGASGLPFLGLLFPGIIGIVNHNNSPSKPPTPLTAPAPLPPCSLGSNEYGACQQ